MATSGEKIFNTGSSYVNRVKYTWSRTAVDVDTNTSTIKVTVLFYRTDGSSSTGYTMNIDKMYVTVNGETKTWISSKTQITNKKSFSATFDIPHNDDGTKSFSLKFYCDTSAYNTINDTATYELDPIARGSQIALNTSAILINSSTYSSSTVGYTITSTGNYYHVLTYGQTGTEATALSNQNVNNTTYSGTVTFANILSQVTNSLNGTVIFRLATYADSAHTTLKGIRTVTLGVSITSGSYLYPTVTLGTETKTGAISGNLVAGYSSMTIPRTSSLKYGATIAGVYITVSISGNSSTVTETSASGTIAIGTLPANTSNATLTVSAYIIDSRGVQGSTASKSYTVYGYGAPTSTSKIYRTASSTSTGQDDGGEYVYFLLAASTSYTVNGSNSIQSITCSYTGSKTGTATNGTHLALSADQTITATVTVTDKVRSYQVLVTTINRATHPVSMARQGANMGVVFGGLATANNKVISKLPIEIGDTTTTLSLKKNGCEVRGYTTIWTGTLQGGSATQINATRYSRLKVYFVSYSSAGTFEIDLTQAVPTPQTSGYPYAGSGVCPYYSSSRVETHVCKASVDSAKTGFKNDWQGYYYGTTYTARNSNSSYYIYRIDGIID